MKTMTTFAAILAAGMALAPIAANAANVPTIAFFAGSQEGIDYGGGQRELSGFAIVEGVIGFNTPSNADGVTGCGFIHGRCNLGFSTGAPIEVGEYQWEGGGNLVILERFAFTTILEGTFVEPVTANVDGTVVSVNGALKDVVIDGDLAAFFGVPNRGTGEIHLVGRLPMDLV